MIKNRKIQRLFFCVSVLTFSAFGNTVRNSGFENEMDGWSVIKAAGNGTAEITTEDSHSGSYCAKIEHSDPESYTLFKQDITVVPKTTYRVSMWIKGESITPSDGGLGGRIFITRNESQRAAISCPSYKGTFGWKKILFIFNSDETVKINVSIYLHKSSGTFWFDDVEIADEATALAKGVEKLPGKNLAAGKTCTFSKPANYHLCTDGREAVKLTDGIFSKDGPIWTMKTAAGWRHAGGDGVSILLDIGSVEPIGVIGVNVVGGGKSDVLFPQARFYVSDDDLKYHLVYRNSGNELDESGTAYVSKYTTPEMKTRGRYIIINLIGNGDGAYVFTDEIEVIKGKHNPADAVFKAETATPKSEVKNQPLNEQSAIRICTRLSNYINEMDKDSDRYPGLKGVLGQLQKELSAVKLDISLQKALAMKEKLKIFNAQRLMSVFKGKKTVVWAKSRWANLSLTELPDRECSALSIAMAQNEIESEQFLIVNSTEKSQDFTITTGEFRSASSALPVSSVSLRQGIFIEAGNGILYPDALPLLNKNKVQAHSGVNIPVWITINLKNTKNIPAGEYKGLCTISSQAETSTIAVTVTIYPVVLPITAPLKTWNYAYPDQMPVMSHEKEAMKDLSDHGINTIVYQPNRLRNFSFDASGKVTGVDWTEHDRFIAMYRSNGMNFFIYFLAFGGGTGWINDLGWFPKKVNKDEFLIGTPQWKRALKEAVTLMIAHLKEINMNYDSFYFLPTDEVNGKVNTEKTVAVCRELKLIDPKIKIMQDPIPRTTLEEIELLRPYTDIWSPQNDMLTNSLQLEFFLNEQKAGKILTTYHCEGTAKSLSCTEYYRDMLWKCWKYNMIGAGFWAYASGVGSLWDDFSGTPDWAIVYEVEGAPAGVSTSEPIIPSRRWEAWRDGIEDYTLLFMLQSAINTGKAQNKNAKALRAAEKSLDEISVLPAAERGNPALYDKSHRMLLEALTKLQQEI